VFYFGKGEEERKVPPRGDLEKGTLTQSVSECLLQKKTTNE
jgi:hypothetical protein